MMPVWGEKRKEKDQTETGLSMAIPCQTDEKSHLWVRSREHRAQQAQCGGHFESLSDSSHHQATQQSMGFLKGILVDSAEILQGVPQGDCTLELRHLLERHNACSPPYQSSFAGQCYTMDSNTAFFSEVLNTANRTDCS